MKRLFVEGKQPLIAQLILRVSTLLNCAKCSITTFSFPHPVVIREFGGLKEQPTANSFIDCSYIGLRELNYEQENQQKSSLFTVEVFQRKEASDATQNVFVLLLILRNNKRPM